MIRPMRSMRLVFPPLVLCLAVASLVAQEGDREDWIQLFNGVDLDGWTPKITGYPVGENYANTFRVEDGAHSGHDERPFRAS